MQAAVSQGSLNDVTSPRQTKQQKKKAEEDRKRKEEEDEERKKIEQEAQEKLEQAQIDAFKNKNRIHLDFV